MTPNIGPCRLGITRATLSALRDEELPPNEVQQLRAHVADCPACRQRLAQFDRIAAALQPTFAPDLRDRVWRGMRPHLTPRKDTPMNAWRLRGVAALVTLTLLVAGFALLFSRFAHTGSTPGSGSAPPFPVTKVPLTMMPPTPSDTAVAGTVTPAPTATILGCQLKAMTAPPTGVPLPSGTVAGMGIGAEGVIETPLCTPGATQSDITMYMTAHLPDAGWHRYDATVDKNGGCSGSGWAWVHGQTGLYYFFTGESPLRWTLRTCSRFNLPG